MADALGAFRKGARRQRPIVSLSLSLSLSLGILSRESLSPKIYYTTRISQSQPTLRYPASAGQIQLSAFRALAPWNLRKGGSESCLCQPCENAEGYTRGRHDAAAHLRPLLAVELDDDAPHDVQPPAPHPLLAELVGLLSTTRKYGMCLALTCGARGNDTKLEERGAECMRSECRRGAALSSLESASLRLFSSLLGIFFRVARASSTVAIFLSRCRLVTRPFPVRFGRSRVPMTRTVHTFSEHYRSSSPGTVSASLKNQRNYKSPPSAGAQRARRPNLFAP